ncbi:MAG: tyrosine-type recombinase/integrase [Candidatus Sedimenticola sp. (ex Thyasira tokunagai)]
MSRSTAWRMVKRVMAKAGIEGKQATAKGLRHGFGIAMLSRKYPLPINVLWDLMGHSDTKTTEIYLQAIGDEKRKLVMQAWD